MKILVAMKCDGFPFPFAAKISLLFPVLSHAGAKLDF
ncbi:hypothetical protein BDE36_1777 [Arcticibacter tournemirensis]|nr:hypothetical protein BDE36_1777 [Arcticibacter tournemirensis]